MTDPNVSARIEAELRRFKGLAEAPAKGPTLPVRAASAPLVGGTGMPHRILYGSDNARLQLCLNLCAAWRCFRRASPPGSPMHRHWHAQLKSKQLELLILRVGNDVHRMRAQGWLEKDPDTGLMHPLEREAAKRMNGLRDRLTRARQRAFSALRDHQQFRLNEAQAREAA